MKTQRIRRFVQELHIGQVADPWRTPPTRKPTQAILLVACFLLLSVVAFAARAQLLPNPLPGWTAQGTGYGTNPSLATQQALRVTLSALPSCPTGWACNTLRRATCEPARSHSGGCLCSVVVTRQCIPRNMPAVTSCPGGFTVDKL